MAHGRRREDAVSRYSDATRNRVRQAIRDGATIEGIVSRFKVSKRFVEDQRVILADSEDIPDGRLTSTGDRIRELDAQGMDVAEIAKKLKVSRAYVYSQRRR